jgi:hypothetical protein
MKSNQPRSRQVSQPGHCLCERHKAQYKPTNIVPAWYVAPEYLETVLYCGRCGRAGEKVRGGLVFGESSMTDGLVQFANQASYWLSPKELERKVLLIPKTGKAA